MSIQTLVKTLQNIMREDAGVDGDAQRLSQIVWLLFLKIYDTKEQDWELLDANYKSIVPAELQWRNWAIDKKDGKALTGEALLELVNTKLFPTLKKLAITKYTPLKNRIVVHVFGEAINYMKDGVALRRVINELNKIDFSDYDELHAFGEIYETLLKSLQSAGTAGEFYTPRAVTDFMANMVKPQLTETVADFACGTGGFLTSALRYKNEIKGEKMTATDLKAINNSFYGIEKKQLPYLLCMTNMLLHGLDEPKIDHINSLEKNIREYKGNEKFDVVLMNPPFGGKESEIVKQNFPIALRSSETADLFMALIMYRLKNNGRCAVVLPDGFLFGSDGSKNALKEKLLNEFNLHTIVRLPSSVFAPYTPIATNILFFDKDDKGTKGTWYYRLDKPQKYKAFSKTKPLLLEHLAPVAEWWNNRKEIIDEGGSDKAKFYSKQDLVARNYDFDLCKYPQVVEEILEPDILIKNYFEKKEKLDTNIKNTLEKITELLGNK